MYLSEIQFWHRTCMPGRVRGKTNLSPHPLYSIILTIILYYIHFKILVLKNKNKNCTVTQKSINYIMQKKMFQLERFYLLVLLVTLCTCNIRVNSCLRCNWFVTYLYKKIITTYILYFNLVVFSFARNSTLTLWKVLPSRLFLNFTRF